MKKLSALLAAALVALTLSMPVYAEPSESSEESAAQESVSETTEESSEKPGEGSTGNSKPSGEASTQQSSKASGQASVQTSSKASSGSSKEESSNVPVEKLNFKEYRVDFAKMDISFPDTMYVITRDTDANDPAFEAYRLTKNEIMENFEKSSTYIRASVKDFSYDITVTVMKNSDTEAVKDLSSLTDQEIESITNNLLKQEVYKGCTKSNINNTLFLSLNMEEETDNTKISGIQEYTIVNGVRVIITFQTYDGVIDPYEQQVFNAVMQTVKFDGVQPAPAPQSSVQQSETIVNSDSFDIRYIYIIIASAIGLIALVVMITAGMRYKKTKRLAEQLEEEEETEIEAPSRGRSTTALVENEDNQNREPEDIYSDTRIEKYGTQEFALDAAMINTAPMTYESLTAGTPVQEKLNEDTVRVTELPETDEISSQESTQPEGFTEITATPEEQPYPAQSAYPEEGTESAPYAASYGQEAPFARPAAEESVSNYPDGESGDEVVFAEITEKRHTGIEQIGVSEQENGGQTEQISAGEPVAETEGEEELSAYEKRFGKNRTTPLVTAAAAASPDIVLVNADEKRKSKFEKHFGKLEPAAQEQETAPAAVQEETVSEEPVIEKPVSEEPVIEEPVKEEPVKEETVTEELLEEEPIMEEQPTETAFSKLIDRLKSSSGESKEPVPAAEPERKPEVQTEPKKSENTIELEISKSADGSLIIGAMRENNGKPLDIEIKNSADLKAERKRELRSMGLEDADKGEIYNHRDAMAKEGFTVKAKGTDEASSEEEEETGSRFDKLFGADREKKPVEPETKQTAAEEENDFEESAFEKRFGKGRSTAAAGNTAGAAAGAVNAAGTAGAAAVIAGTVTAASAGTAAVAAVFGKAEKAKGKKKHQEEPSKPETVEEFFEGVKAEKTVTPPAETAQPAAETAAAAGEPVAEQRKSRRDEFMFERDSGIIFEHARESRQPIQPMFSSFTKVPRLEDVNAEEYNKQYEEMKKSMPKNQAYAQRFGGGQPAPAPVEPAVQTEPAAPAAPAVPAGKSQPKNGKQKKDDNVIEFYTGYDEDDPFGGSADPNQEVIIKDHKKKNGSVGSRFKKSFGKFFSGEVPEDEE